MWVPLVVLALVVAIAGGLSLWRRLGSEEASPQQAQEDQPVALLRRDGFERLFQPGATVQVAQAGAQIEVRDLGSLDLPSGRLIACDPLVQAEIPDLAKPFTVTVPPGRYPVSISVVRWERDGQRDMRVAAARMTVRPDPVVRWEMALQPDADPGKLTGEKFFGFGVDAGTAGFLDADSVEALGRIGGDAGPLDKALMDAAGKTLGADVRDPASGRNVIAFYSGFGDGSYPTWIGRTVDNQPAVFVTDFHVVDHP